MSCALLLTVEKNVGLTIFYILLGRIKLDFVVKEKSPEFSTHNRTISDLPLSHLSCIFLTFLDIVRLGYFLTIINQHCTGQGEKL